MDQFPHHIRPLLRDGDYYLARYFCEGLAVEVRGEVFCFQGEADAEKFKRKFGCVRFLSWHRGRASERTTLLQIAHRPNLDQARG